MPELDHRRAILAVELYDVAFDFGPVTYQNIEIVATTAASEWCNTQVSLGYTSGVRVLHFSQNRILIVDINHADSNTRSLALLRTEILATSARSSCLASPKY